MLEITWYNKRIIKCNCGGKSVLLFDVDKTYVECKKCGTRGPVFYTSLQKNFKDGRDVITNGMINAVKGWERAIGKNHSA